MVSDLVLFIAALIFFIIFCFIWSFHFIAYFYARHKFYKTTRRVPERDKLPGVSIIKPLMGIDDNLEQNLETFFTMDYPLYELLFCVQDNTDPVINLVRRLLDKYPHVDAKLFAGGMNVGINPKINNMNQGYEQAKYELFLISDAGLTMSPDTLYDMVSLMREKVGLVHQMPFVCDRTGFAGALEKIYFGTCHCRLYMYINFIGVNCVTGMSCLMRKKVIDQAGGLKKFSNYIAEDYFLAQEFLDNKWTIQVSHQPAMQNSAAYSVKTWQKRMIRWCKLRLKLNLMSWFEPMQECFMLGIATSWTVTVLFGWNSLVFFLFHVLGWFIMDYLLLKIVQNDKLPFSKCEFVAAWLYRETICYWLFLKAAVNPTVKWRHGKYRLKWGGLAQEIVLDEEASKKIDSTSSSPNASLIVTVVPSSQQQSNNAGGGSTLVTPTTVTGTSMSSLNSTTSSASVSSNSPLTKQLDNLKRTNSFSANHNNSSHSSMNPNFQYSNNNSATTNNNNNSIVDLDHATSTLLLLQGQKATMSPTTTTGVTISSSTKRSYKYHQHHHSISNPISHNSSTTLMDLHSSSQNKK